MKIKTHFGLLIEDDDSLGALSHIDFEKWHDLHKHNGSGMSRREAIIAYKHYLSNKLATPFGIVEETDDLGKLDRGDFIKWARLNQRDVPMAKRKSESDLVLEYKRHLAQTFISRYEKIAERIRR